MRTSLQEEEMENVCMTTPSFHHHLLFLLCSLREEAVSLSFPALSLRPYAANDSPICPTSRDETTQTLTHSDAPQAFSNGSLSPLSSSLSFLSASSFALHPCLFSHHQQRHSHTHSLTHLRWTLRHSLSVAFGASSFRGRGHRILSLLSSSSFCCVDWMK